MPDKLRRLLQSHEFLDRALKEYGAAMAAADAENLRADRARVFNELVEHTSADPRVTIAQISFLMAGLAALSANSAEAQRLRAACTHHVERLAGPALSQEQYGLLDSMTDRVGIYDRNYRYVFTNKANAAFHGRRQSEFIGLPSWTVVGQECFETVTRPKLDACFAGRSVTFVAGESDGAASTIYSVRYDPIRDRSGGVTSALVVARDVTSLAVRSEMDWPLPDE